MVITATDKDLHLAKVQVTDQGTEAFRTDAYMKSMVDIYKTRKLYAVLWAISSEGNRSANPAVIPFTP